MKRQDLIEKVVARVRMRKQPFTSLIRAVAMVDNSKSASDQHVSVTKSSKPFLICDGIQKMDEHLLKMERSKEEALQRIRERNRCI
jgi:hypothetical protein